MRTYNEFFKCFNINSVLLLACCDGYAAFVENSLNVCLTVTKPAENCNNIFKHNTILQV